WLHPVQTDPPTESATGLYGSLSAGPATINTIQGYDLFNVTDGPDGNATGDTVYAFEYGPTLPSGTANIAYSVSDDVPGATPDTSTPVPNGSVCSTFNFLGSPNYSSATPSSDGDVITDIWKTPLGNVDLSWLFGGFDAAHGLADHQPLSAPPLSIQDHEGS